MFYYLEGIITIIEPNLAVVDVNGAGYGVSISTATLAKIELGKKARLLTYCNIREDAFDIYGFCDAAEKRAFEMLLGVSGVGPKVAVSILSVCSPEALALAVINDDTGILTQASGVGKKVAQRIVLELKDKVAKQGFAISASPGTPARPGGAPGTSEQASLALAALGYTQSEISAALRKIDITELTTEQIIRAVLSETAKNIK